MVGSESTRVVVAATSDEVALGIAGWVEMRFGPKMPGVLVAVRIGASCPVVTS